MVPLVFLLAGITAWRDAPWSPPLEAVY